MLTALLKLAEELKNFLTIWADHKLLLELFKEVPKLLLRHDTINIVILILASLLTVNSIVRLYLWLRTFWSEAGRRIRATELVFYPTKRATKQHKKVHMLVPTPHEISNSIFKAASGGEIQFDFKPAEKQSLNKMDARGITEILGALGDCRIGIEDIEVKTFVPRDDDTTCSDSWDQLKRGSSGAAIAFGSAQVNGLTKAVLRSQRVRFEICSTGQSITIDHDGGPKVFKISDCRDFAIQAKIRVTAGTVGGFCFVFAGLGPLGTVKACAHLVNTIRETSRQYGNAPFIRVLAVPRGGQLEADQIEVIAEGAIGRATYWQCVWHPQRSWKIWRQFCAVRAHGMPLTTEGDAILRSLRCLA